MKWVFKVSLNQVFRLFLSDLFQTPARSKQKPDELAHILHGLFFLLASSNNVFINASIESNEKKMFSSARYCRRDREADTYQKYF